MPSHLTLGLAARHRGAMSDNKPLGRKKSLLLGLAIVGVLTLVALGLLLRVMSVREIVALGSGLVDRVLGWFRVIGAGPFFAAMAVLPAIGFPVMAFSLSAGPAFAPQLGLGWVITLVVLSLGINVTLTYWLARYALRPFIERLVQWLGYSLPQLHKDDHLSLALLTRIMPGPPFFAQSYLLGLAKVPFWTYLWVSWSISSVYSVALVVSVVKFKDSMRQGPGSIIFFVVCLIIVVFVGVRWLRRYARRRSEAA